VCGVGGGGGGGAGGREKESAYLWQSLDECVKNAGV
jgi:hypothetical protein